MKVSIKTSFQIICFAVGVIFFSSCNDFLDRQEDEKLTFDKIWETRNDTRSYWLNSMSFLPDDAGDFTNLPWLGAVSYTHLYSLEI